MGARDSGASDYELGVTLVSVLVSITASVGFGVYSITQTWWAAIIGAVAAPAALAVLIRVGGEDGVIPRMGRWMLKSDR